MSVGRFLPGDRVFRYVFLIVICCSQQRQVLEWVGGLPRPIQPVAEHALFRRTEEAATARFDVLPTWQSIVLKVICTVSLFYAAILFPESG